MKESDYSRFIPEKLNSQGRKTVMPYYKLTAVEGDTSALSVQAQKIHEWLKQRNEELGREVEAVDIVRAFGTGRWHDMRQMTTYSLRGYPIEELVDAGLITIGKGPV